MSKKYTTLRNKSKDTCFIYPNIDPEHNIPDGSIPFSKLEGGGLPVIVVDELPTEDIKPNTIYLVPSGEEEPDYYDEFIYVNGQWEKIGNTRIDMSQYAKKLYPTFIAEEDSSIVADFVGKQFNERAMIRFIGKDGDWLGWIGVSGNAPQFVNRAGAIHQIVTLDTTEFKNKLDKVTTTGSNRVYIINSQGEQGTYSYEVSQPYPYTFAVRGDGGVVKVGTPLVDNDATNKKYVDGLLKHYVHNIKLKSTDTTITLQIIDKSSTAYTLATLITYLSTNGFDTSNKEYPASGTYGTSFRPISGIAGSGLFLYVHHSNTFNQQNVSNYTLTDIVVEV